MTHFIKTGGDWHIVEQDAINIHEALPAGCYAVKVNAQTGEIYLQVIDAFEKPNKVYGSAARHTQRIMGTFQQRTASTGVLLSGEKGSGKSLQARLLSIACAEAGMPSLVINTAVHGDAFNAFIQRIAQPALVLFDEFEKIYSSEEQEKLLTLLDGVYASKKLFVMTCNDPWRIDKHMKNRPGRIFYMLEYRGLDLDFIREYCEDTLINADHVHEVCTLSNIFSAMNFDMLQAWVEEINRWGETPKQALELLNCKPELEQRAKYTVTLIKQAGQAPAGEFTMDELQANPFSDRDIEVYKNHHDEDGQSHYDSMQFSCENILAYDAATEILVLQNAQGDVIHLRKKPATAAFNAFSHLAV